MDESRPEALRGVGKRAVVAVLAFANLLRVASAELGLVFLRVVHRLDPVVTQIASIAFWAIFSVLVLAQVRCIRDLD